MKETKFSTWLRANAGYVGVPDEKKPVKVTREELGGLLVEYFLEAEHGGWDGFSSRDQTGICRFLDDLVRYYENCPQGQFNRPFFTGVITYPTKDETSNR